MTPPNDPISRFNKLNAALLLAVTPEYAKIKAASTPGAGRAEKRPVSFAMQPEYRTIAGIKMRFAEGGNADGPLVLLLCPLPQSILCFDPVWEKLGKQCRLVALDLPGFGRSEGGLEVMSFDAQSRFLESFFAALDLHQAHIVGPDVGMAVALHYVIHREHRAASLLIGDGPGILPTANGSIINKAVNSALWRRVFCIAGAGAFVEGACLLACTRYVPSTAEVADYVASYAGRIGPVTYWFKNYPQNLATVDPHLASLDLPVQIFWGELDQFLLLDNAERLHQRLPRSQLKVFKGAGHFCYQDSADDFAAMVLDWVADGHRSVGRCDNPAPDAPPTPTKI